MGIFHLKNAVLEPKHQKYTLNAATFMGKCHSTMQNVVQNEEKITLKQMFDVTAQMINNNEEICCLDKIKYRGILGHNCR